MKNLTNLLLWLRDFTFPSACALCARSFISAGEMRLGLCETCLAALESEQEQTCKACGRPLISEMDSCLPCRNMSERSYRRLWTFFPYTGKYRKLLSGYKFQKNLALANFMAVKAVQLISSEPLLKNAVIVPVPPRPGKIKETGWDQVEYLVKRLEKLLPAQNEKGVPFVSRCLKRNKSGVQKRLSRAGRMENLRGRITLEKAAPACAIIIDDVITTGSTLEVCAQALREGGAQEVFGLCLFYD